MRKTLLLIFVSVLFLGCATETPRFTQMPENPTPNQVFPGEGYSQAYNPNADAYFLALRGFDSNGASIEGPQDFPSIPLRTLERDHFYDPGNPPEDAQDLGPFFLGSGEYWNGEHWVYPRYPRRHVYPYPYPYYPRRPQPPAILPEEGEVEGEGRPAGSSFNGGPVHQEQGFQDNHGSTGIPGQGHNNTHR